MSVIIHQFIVHQLRLDSDKKMQLLPRKACMNVTPSIESLVEQIHSAFNAKPGKGVGGFATQSEEQTFTVADGLSTFRTAVASDANQTDAFQLFSQQSAELLLKTLADMQMVETGFLVFCRYEYLATEYLMITLLSTKKHVHVDDNLELTVSEHLDLAKMQLAARIDLTQLALSPEINRYISFIKGRMGRKVSDFFMTFLGCEELMDVKKQNAQLINSVDAFLASEQLDIQEKQAHRGVVQEYYKEKLASGDDIQLAELTSRLPVNEEQNFDFSQFVKAEEVEIDEKFQPDKSMLKTLAKFTGQGGGISLSFDRALYGERVRYDEQTDTLVIRGIPPNLKDQLSRAK